jgi:hypothetical protein
MADENGQARAGMVVTKNGAAASLMDKSGKKIWSQP